MTLYKYEFKGKDNFIYSSSVTPNNIKKVYKNLPSKHLYTKCVVKDFYTGEIIKEVDLINVI